MELDFLKLLILKKIIKYYCNFNWNNKDFVNRLEKNDYYRGFNLGAKEVGYAVVLKDIYGLKIIKIFVGDLALWF